MRRRQALSLLAVLLGAAGPPPREAGSWLTQDHSSVIRIDGCGDGLCGRIVGISLDRPTDPPPRDNHGALQCGQTIIRMPRQGNDGRWHGTILDPRSGRRWSAEIWLASGGSLRLRGFLGIPLFGATQDWTRYSGSPAPDCRFARTTP